MPRIEESLSLAPGDDLQVRLHQICSDHFAQKPGGCEEHSPPEPMPFVRCELNRFRTPVPLPDGRIRVEFAYWLEDCPVCRVRLQGVPPLDARFAFDTFTATTDELRDHLAKVREFTAAPAGFLFLLGTVGNGKTHLAVSALREFGRGRYVRHLQLVEELRASYRQKSRTQADEDEEESLANKCRWTPLLVLDELGVAPGGNDAETLLYDILDYRVTHLLPTVLCGNIEAGQLESQFGTRLADRFRQAAFAVLNFTGPSYRSKANAAYLAQARARANEPWPTAPRRRLAKPQGMSTLPGEEMIAGREIRGL